MCQNNYFTKVIDGDLYIKSHSFKDFKQEIKCMGFKNLEEFKNITGIEYRDIKNKWWMLINNKIYIH